MRSTWIAAIGGGMCMSAAASAAIVHVDLSGTFIPSLMHGGSPYGITTASTYNASFEYDTSLPTASALLSLSVTLHNTTGDVTISADTFGGTFDLSQFFKSPNTLAVAANPVGELSSSDHLQASATDAGGPGPAVQLFANLSAPSGTHPLNGVQGLPTTVDSSFLSPQSYFQVLQDFSNYAQGSIETIQSSIVPAPTGAAALLTGAGFMARRRRR